MSHLLMTQCVLGFLAAALLLYVVFGGADFGGGILENFLGKRLRKEQEAAIVKALGPVWEANHVWLILAVVILFTAFPEVYASVSVYMHLPITALLLGITLRGCAFTFRSYDAVKSPRSQRWYTRLFRISSLMTPFFMGLIVGGATSGKIPPGVKTFCEIYVVPWCNLYSAAIGVFAIALFAMVAAVFLCDETADPALRRLFRRRAIWANAAAFVLGGLVFAAAEFDDVPLVQEYLASPVSIACICLTSVLVFPLHLSLYRGSHHLLTRTYGAALLGLILLGWFAALYPNLMIMNGRVLDAYSVAAPDATLRMLLIALVGGTVLILPALGWLFVVFKRPNHAV